MTELIDASDLVFNLAVSNFYFSMNAKSALRKLKRALADRKEMVKFLERYSRTLVSSKDEKQWLQSMAGFLADAIKTVVIRIYVVGSQNRLCLAGEDGKMIFPFQADDDEISEADIVLSNISQDVIDMGDGVIGKVAKSGKKYFKNYKEKSPEYFTSRFMLRSVVVIPMTIEKRIIGVICAVNKQKNGFYFTEDDINLMESLANQIAIGGTLFQIYEDLGEQYRIQQELSLARGIQDSLLPEKAPESDGFRIYGTNKAAREVSGDFYDFVEIDENYLMVLIADASGKGVPACMIMSMCRIFVRANAPRYMDNLEGLLKELNYNLYKDTDEDRFVTLAICLIDKRDFTVEYARAGHTELLIRQPNKEVQVIRPDGPALGLIPPDNEIVDFDTFAFSWLPNTSLMLFTDGITEALNYEEKEFGLDRLKSKFSQSVDDPEKSVHDILESVKNFSSSKPQTDDQTLVILNRTN